MWGFLMEALPIVFLGVFVVNILYSIGVLDVIGRVASPVVVHLLGLPEEAVIALIMGFLRKDVAIGMLVPLTLTAGQLVVASVVLSMFFPCIATFIVLVKELGPLKTVKSTAIMITSAIAVGSILNLFV